MARVYEETLSFIVPILNITHSLDRDIRYWRIIVGPWLRCFIDALFDRYECVRLAHKNNQTLSCRLYPYNVSDWSPTDFPDFWNQFNPFGQDRMTDLVSSLVCREEETLVIYHTPKHSECFKNQNKIKTYIWNHFGLYPEKAFVYLQLNLKIKRVSWSLF